MANTSNSLALKPRDLGYYRQRQKNRVFAKIAQFFNDCAERNLINKKQLAEKLGKDPAQITRLLSGPSNVTLDTISDVLLAMEAEMDIEIVSFSDRLKPNFAHNLHASIPFQISKTTTANDSDIHVINKIPKVNP